MYNETIPPTYDPPDINLIIMLERIAVALERVADRLEQVSGRQAIRVDRLL